ncbi:MAG: LysE family transporter [Pseudomonadota bacterium]
MTLVVADLISFNAILIAALLSPGAAMLFLIKSTVAGGRAAGIWTGLGLASVAALWTLAALLGLDVLFRVFPWTFSALKIGGALYLIWLAIQTWRHARAPLSKAAIPAGRTVLSGMLVNLANPKSVLFAAAVILVVFPQGIAAFDIAIIVLNHFVLELVFYTGLALALSTPVIRNRYLSFKPVFDRIAATMLGVFGMRLLMEK